LNDENIVESSGDGKKCNRKGSVELSEENKIQLLMRNFSYTNLPFRQRSVELNLFRIVALTKAENCSRVNFYRFDKQLIFEIFYEWRENSIETPSASLDRCHKYEINEILYLLISHRYEG
jgi:hypothetical protein